MTREQFIDKACRQLVEHTHDAAALGKITCTSVMTEGTLIEDFRKAMGAKEPLTTIPTNPWHKASEELPKMANFTTDGDFSDLCICINESGQHKILVLCQNDEYTYWSYGYDGEELYDEEVDGGAIIKWMYIPENKEETK